MTLPWLHQANTFNPEARRRFADITVRQRNPLARDGFLMLPPMPRESALELADRLRGAATVKEEGALEYFETELLLAQPEFRAIATSQGILYWVAMHLGAPPIVQDIGAWRTTASNQTPLSQQWHRDTDDWVAAKLFLYLSDVDEERGPHQFIPGSHRHEWFASQGLPPDRYFVGSSRNPEIASEVEKLPRRTTVGAAGTMWLELTYGLHRGMPVQSGERMLFQISYGITPWTDIGTKREPIAEAWGLEAP